MRTTILWWRKCRAWYKVVPDFHFDSGALELNKPVTTRGLLAVTNSVYDPLGFFAPAILEARVIYRSACRERSDWDEPLPDLIRVKWERWCKSLSNLQDLEIKPLGLRLHFFLMRPAMQKDVCAICESHEETNQLNVI